MYLISVAFRYTLIGFGPDVCFAMKRGINILIICLIESISTILSFGIPSSISLKVVTFSVAAKLNFYKHSLKFKYVNNV